MGAGTSKQSNDGSKHVFASETPVQFSQELVNSLQASSETDGSRAQSLELHIQSRVAEELARLQKREEDLLADIRSKLSSSESPDPSDSSKSSSGSESPASSALSSLLPGGSKKDDKKKLGRESVLKEIESLKEKLGQRKKLVEVDKEVEKAKADVAACLRLNDRRPLDCWREVARFKEEVAKMEGRFVEKVMS